MLRFDLLVNKRFFMMIASLLLGVLSNPSLGFAQGPTHAYINSVRSGVLTHYFVSISAEGEFGSYTQNLNPQSANEPTRVSDHWQGYGVHNEIGVEFLKFLQFHVGHSSVSIRNRDRASENMTGSRFDGGGDLNFYSPVGNVTVGAGLLASRLDYRREAQTADFYGTGYYYNVGYLYFFSPSVSVYLNGRQGVENHVRSGGDKIVRNIKAEWSSIGIGFRLWLK